MGFRGIVPGKQPRTARSNAEQKGTTPNGFVPDVPYNPQAGCPLYTVGASTTYNDEAHPVPENNGEKRRDQKAPFVVTNTGK